MNRRYVSRMSLKLDVETSYRGDQSHLSRAERPDKDSY